MGKRSKSRRFVSEGAKTVQKHDEVFTYRERFSDAERKQQEADRHTVGGF
jgi:hypothetical protein